MTVVQDWKHDGIVTHKMVVEKSTPIALPNYYSNLKEYSGAWIKSSKILKNRILTTILVPMTTDRKSLLGDANKLTNGDCPINIPALFIEK